MEKSILEQRIEERAKERLLTDLKQIADKEFTVSDFIGRELYPTKLNVQMYYPYSGGKEILTIKNEFTKQVFDAALPRYIKDVTDEILGQIDQIADLVNNQHEKQD